jgi:hypothetical protein
MIQNPKLAYVTDLQRPGFNSPAVSRIAGNLTRVAAFARLKGATCSVKDDWASTMPKWRNWQTRVVQVHVLARVWGFESLLRHQASFLSLMISNK